MQLVTESTTIKDKPVVKLPIYEARMLGLIEILKQQGIIRFQQEFCDTLGMKKQNLRAVRTGKGGFTSEQKAIVFKVYGINPSYIYGYSDQVFMDRQNMKATG